MDPEIAKLAGEFGGTSLAAILAYVVFMLRQLTRDMGKVTDRLEKLEEKDRNAK